MPSNRLFHINSKKSLFDLLKLSFMVVVFLYFGFYLKANWAEFSQAMFELPLMVIILSTILMAIGHTIRGALWAPVRYEISGLSMSLWEAIYISSISRLGRYLPGKIWAFAGKAAMSTANKSDLPINSGAVIFEVFYLELILLLFGIVALLLSGFADLFIKQFWLIIVAIPLFVFVCVPKVFIIVFNKLLKAIRQNPINSTISKKSLLLIALGNVLAVCFWSYSFILVVSPHVVLNLNEIIGLSGVHAIGWFMGFIVLIAPAGLGVRESINLAGLQTICNISVHNAFAIVIAARIVSVLADLAALAIGLICIMLLKLKK